MTAPAGGARAARLVMVAAGLAIGSSAWLSLGTVALTDAARGTRLVALPPWTWLGGLVLVAISVLHLLRPPPRALVPLALLVLPWLPWLPFTVPPAALIWDGPLEGAVWLVALSGVAVVWWRLRTVPAGANWWTAARAPWLAAGLMALLATAAWLTVRPHLPSGDEPHYLVITQSLIGDRDLRIENNHRQGDYLAYFAGALRPDFMRRGSDRQIYSIHAPGTAVLVLPGFLFAGYAGAVVTVILLVSAGLAGLWRAARRLGHDTTGAWIAALALMLAAPYLLMAFTIYPDPIGSVVVIVALGALVRLETGAGLSPVSWTLVGAALAALPWLHTRFAVLAGSAGLVLAARALTGPGGLRDLLRLLAVPLLSAAAWFGYFQIIYGTPDPGAPYGDGTGSGLKFVRTGLVGLLIDQQFGLFTTAPVLGVGALGLVTLARQRPRLVAELALLVGPYLLTAAAFPMWWGGYSSPARFAVVVAPVFALPIATLWRRGATTTRTAIVAALVVSAALTAATVGVDRGAFVYNNRDGHALLLDWLSAAADLTLALPSVHRDGTARAAADAGVWLLVAAAACGVLWRLRRWRGVAVLRWLALPAVVMMAATLVWARRTEPVLSPADSVHHALLAWRSGRLPVAAQLAPFRTLDATEVAGRLLLTTTARGTHDRANGPLLRVADVPAGDYDVFIDAGGEPAGQATVQVGRVGRSGLAMTSWRFEGRRAGYSGLTLSLPVDVRELSIVGDDGARRSIRSLSLRPRRVVPAAGQAQRGARYGTVDVFALDDHVFLESGAFWVEGGEAARLVVQGPDGAGARLRMRTGPIANTVRLSAGAWHHEVSLAADAEVDVELPPEALAPATLTIDPASGFRPAAHGGGDDVRWLGVYVTWPAPSGTGAAGGR